MLPYGLNQKVEFKKNFGPILGKININEMSKLDEVDFVQKVYPVYKAIKKGALKAPFFIYYSSIFIVSIILLTTL